MKKLIFIGLLSLTVMTTSQALGQSVNSEETEIVVVFEGPAVQLAPGTQSENSESIHFVGPETTLKKGLKVMSVHDKIVFVGPMPQIIDGNGIRTEKEPK